MDLYADLPLAKGARSSAALDADGKPKAAPAKGSVWASAPLMVPQAAKAKGSARPVPIVTSSEKKSSNPEAPPTAKTGSISLAFRPASITRKSVGVNRSAPVKQPQQVQTQKPADTGDTKPPQRAVGVGLGYSTVTEVRRSSPHGAKAVADVDTNAPGSPTAVHFFQTNYRDEYDPSRPNSYEAYCKERLDKKKLEEVKRELGRRQREQEREGKLEREKLAKDLAEGRAPAMQLPSAAGRGRGMTVPAWMRKKIEASTPVTQPESERDGDGDRGDKSGHVNADAVADQFEDADGPRGGLGLSRGGIGVSSTSSAASGEPSRGGLGFRRASPAEAVLRPDTMGSALPYKQERRVEDSHGPVDKRRRTGWDQKSSVENVSRDRVVLLQNMVGPGEVDGDLQDEVKGECEEKYGPVTKCVIREVTGRVAPEEAVQIFVQFQRAQDAEKALTGLSGRFFGGRKVKAVLFDGARFDRMDLTGQ